MKSMKWCNDIMSQTDTKANTAPRNFPNVNHKMLPTAAKNKQFSLCWTLNFISSATRHDDGG
jgi:hypothetical protein